MYANSEQEIQDTHVVVATIYTTVAVITCAVQAQNVVY